MKYHLCSLIHERAPKVGDAAITISTNDVDRYNDILVPEGADVSAYERNPVVLFGHDIHALPIGRTEHLRIVPGKGITADFSFLTGDDFASRVKNAFDQKVLNGASVGFLPKKSEPIKGGGLRYTQWELLEWSLVTVPANSAAVRVLKSLGLDGPAPLARASIALRSLTDQLKAGRVLSRAHETRLKHASQLLTTVLREPDADEPTEDDGVITLDTPTGPVRVSQATLDSAISRIAHDELARDHVVLRIGNERVNTGVTEAELMALIRATIERTIRMAGGSVD